MIPSNKGKLPCHGVTLNDCEITRGNKYLTFVYFVRVAECPLQLIVHLVIHNWSLLIQVLSLQYLIVEFKNDTINVYLPKS